MSEWIVVDHTNDRESPVDSRADGEDTLEDFAGDLRLDLQGPNGEIVESNYQEVTDGGSEVNGQQSDGDVQQAVQAVEATKAQAAEQLPDDGPSVDEDPLTWMPSDFTDEIDGTVAINRKGFEVLAHHYDIQCDTDVVITPPETDFTYCMVKAVAVDADGDEYGAYGEAHSNEIDEEEMVRYADTRAYKRAVSRATGVGMIAVEELQS